MRAAWLASMMTFLLAGAAGADVWDVGSDTDNNTGTDNELTHGTVQTHDLGALPGPVADEDWYRLYMPQYTSWEVLVDGTTGDICNGFGAGVDLQQFGSDGTTTLFSSLGVSPFQCTRSIDVTNFDIGNAPSSTFVRVRGVDCTTNCDANDQYTIHARETTLYVPRFNNSSTQVTVCIIQNGDDLGADVRTAFFDGTGAFLYFDSLFLQPHATRVFNTATQPALAGKSGSAMIQNDARYGRLQGKCVAVEPATGFTFDTLAVLRPD